MKSGISLLLALTLSAATLAQDGWDKMPDADWGDDWQQEEKPSPWTLNGFVDFGGGDFTRDNVVEDSASLLELRTQFSANRYFGNTFFSSKTELLLDKVDSDHTHLDIRELYINHGFNDHWSLRIGQQVLTWGTGDFVFLNDYFPKDWQAMFSGRDDDYLKAPSASIKTTFYSSVINIDTVITPNFTPDTYITGERFSYFNPALGEIVAAPPRVKAEKPSNNEKNAQYFMRLFKTYQGIEYAIYLYRGFYTQPLGYSPELGRNIFPRLNNYGASIRSPLLGGIGNIEIAYADSIDDPKGNDPFIPNSQIQWLTGFEREIIRNLTAGMQLLVRKQQDHEEELAAAFKQTYVVDEWQKLVTLRITHLALQQKLTTSFFVFHSPNDDDYYIKPRVSYRFDDHWLYVIGANYFNGDKEHTQWGQFENNSNIYARIKYSF